MHNSDRSQTPECKVRRGNGRNSSSKRTSAKRETETEEQKKQFKRELDVQVSQVWRVMQKILIERSVTWIWSGGD